MLKIYQKPVQIIVNYYFKYRGQFGNTVDTTTTENIIIKFGH